MRTVLVLLCAAFAACGSLETARVVELGDVPEAESIRRPEGEAPAPILVDTDHWMKSTIATSISVEPPLEDYVRDVLEDYLQVPLDTVRVDFVGYRYAYTFPSRRDDFVLRVELVSEGTGLEGEFEGVLGGDELFKHYELFNEDWERSIPSTATAEERAADDKPAALQRWADRRAYQHRLMIRLATERLARAVPTRLLVPTAPERDPDEPLRFKQGG
jgi:hypothetical protein